MNLIFRVLRVDLHALEVALRLDVDHTGDRIRPVHRRGAAGDDVHLLNESARDRIDVDALIGAPRLQSLAVQ